MKNIHDDSILAQAIGGFAGRIVSGCEKPVALSLMEPNDRDYSTELIHRLREGKSTQSTSDDSFHRVQINDELLFEGGMPNSIPIEVIWLERITSRYG